MTMKKALKTIDRGSVIDYAGQKWVVLEHDPAGRVLCLAAGIIEDMAFDEGNSNNFAKASSNRYLNGPFLDNLIDAAGTSSAFLKTELDLTADDGLKDYGTCPVTIFLLTVDLYRRNRDVIPVVDGWWWLATAVSTEANGYPSLARYVGIRWHAVLGHRLLRQRRPAPRLLSGLRPPDLRRGGRRHRCAGRGHRQGAGRELRRQLRHRGAAQGGRRLHARHAAGRPGKGGAA